MVEIKQFSILAICSWLFNFPVALLICVLLLLHLGLRPKLHYLFHLLYQIPAASFVQFLISSPRPSSGAQTPITVTFLLSIFNQTSIIPSFKWV